MENKWSEIGTPGLSVFGGYIQQAYNAELNWPGVFALYNRIRRSDPEITIVRQAFTALSRKVEVEVVTADSPNDTDKRASEFMESELENVEGGFTAWLESCISYAPFMGWAWWETVPGLRKQGWRPPDGDAWESAANDGLIGVRRLGWRDHSSFFRWAIDDGTGRLRGMEQLDSPNPIVTLPIERGLHITFGDANNPEGLSPLEAIWRLERYKFSLELVYGIGSEHAAGYLDVKKTTEGEVSAADKTNIKAAARAILAAQEGNYAIWPFGFEGKIMDVTFSAAPTLLESIRYYGLLKLQLYNMQWMAIASTAGTGAYSAMSDASSMFLATYNAMIAGFMDQYNNQVGKRLIQWNKGAFAGLQKRPLYRARPLTKIVDLAELGQFIATIKDIMPLGDEDFITIRRQSGVLPETLPEVEEKTPEPPTPETDSASGELASSAASAGVMIAFFLPDDIAQKTAVSPGVLPPGSDATKPESLHLTLLYLGTTQKIAVSKQALLEAVGGFAEWSQPIKGHLNGYGRFANNEGDGTNALYAVFDSQPLPEFRQGLVRCLYDSLRLVSPSEHGFVPHVTLAYIPDNASIPAITLPFDEIVFDEIVVAWGNEQFFFQLGSRGSRPYEFAMPQLGNNSIDPKLTEFYGDLEELALAAVNGQIDEPTFADRAEELALAALLLAFLMGGGNPNRPEAQAVFEERKTAVLSEIALLTNAIYNGQYSARKPTETVPGQTAEAGLQRLRGRLELSAFMMAGAYTLGQLFKPAKGDGERTYEWFLGRTVNHCTDCYRLKGQVHTANEWLAYGYLPQSRRLECGGHRCDCGLRETDKPSQGFVF